jgi:hypothetical protein
MKGPTKIVERLTKPLISCDFDYEKKGLKTESGQN